MSLRRVGIGVLILLLLAASLIVQIGKAAASDPAIVTTQQGAVQGNVQPTFRSFLGIPYAAPPVGNLRFKPPQPHAPWSGVLDATRPGSSCPQAATPFGTASVNEDCLFLNVYTPNPVKTNLPVMIWIHGGAFVTGEGSDYDPSATLVTQGNVIVVTINYRLGAFGFLALPSLSAEDSNGSSGNYGLQDQQFAFKWVKNNIQAFGGNPNLVTIFGESAGGISVCANIASPGARGLFQRAITESGPCTFTLPTLASAEQSGATFAASLGCAQQVAAEQTACLRSLNVQQILAQQPAGFNVGGTGSLLAFGPNIDGSVIPQAPTNALLTGAYNHVPVLEGTNQTEGRLFIALAFDLLGGGPLTAAQYPTAVANLVGSQVANQVLQQYPLSDFSSPDVALSAIFGDAGFSCPARAADQLLALGVPTFAYEFNDTNAPMLFLPPVSFPYGATHTDELQYLFQINGQASLLNANQTKLSNQMMSYWTQFAKFGNPNSFSTAPWAAYATLTDNFQSLVPPLPTVEFGFSNAHHCGFWTQIALEEGLG
ncbi:MAG TPA: carboxylesterase/lipase family protein [Ktedonobacterales bacterium]|nr:carboxylesterase/lipase family protein [Ktedonobacterales bacterium]